MKKLITIFAIIIACVSLVSCGNTYNGVEYDYDGVLDLEGHLDSKDLTGKKIFLKEYVIVQSPYFSDDTRIELNDSATLTIIDSNGDCLPAGTYGVPILIEITGDGSTLDKRILVAKVIG